MVFFGQKRREAALLPKSNGHSGHSGNGVAESASRMRAAIDENQRTVANVRSRLADLRTAVPSDAHDKLVTAMRKHLATHECAECQQLLVQARLLGE